MRDWMCPALARLVSGIATFQPDGDERRRYARAEMVLLLGLADEAERGNCGRQRHREAEATDRRP
jgi:hypothetical protein